MQRARLTRVGGLGGQEPSPASPASANGPSVPVTDPPHRGVSPFTMCLWSLSFTQISQPAEVEGETEAQRGRLTCSTSHSCSADLGPCRVAGEHRPRLPPRADHAGRSADTPGAVKQIQTARRSTAQRQGAPCLCSPPPSCASLLPFAVPAPACSPLSTVCTIPCAPPSPLPSAQSSRTWSLIFNDQLPLSCPSSAARPSWVTLCRGGVGGRTGNAVYLALTAPLQ